jgi:hypothetical protein
MLSSLRGTIERRSPAILILIVVAALALRIGFWIAVVGFDTTGWGDEPDYHRIAAGIASGKGFLSPGGEPTARRPPLYPILLAGLYSVTGPDPDAARAANVALGCVIVLLVYSLGAKLFSKTVGLVAAALVAVNPSLIYLSALIMTENLYVVLLLLLLLSLAADYRASPGTTGRWIAGGALAGLSYLTRPTSLLLALAVAAAPLVLGRGGFGKRLAKSALFLVVAALVVVPWGARNHARLGAWVFSTTHGGITFYESNNRLVYDVPAFHGTVVGSRKDLPGWDALAPLGELEFDRAAWKMGKDFVRENVDLLPQMAAWKFQRFWRLRSDLNLSAATGRLMGGRGGGAARLLGGIDIGFAYSVIVIPLFLLGVVFTARRWRGLVLLYAVVAVHVLVALAFHGSLRARMPIEPVMALFASSGLAGIARAATRRSGPAPRAAAATRTTKTGTGAA